MMHLAEWYRNAEPRLDYLQIGGGIAGDFPICVVPMLRQDLGEKAPLWGWFIKFLNPQHRMVAIQEPLQVRKSLGAN